MSSQQCVICTKRRLEQVLYAVNHACLFVLGKPSADTGRYEHAADTRPGSPEPLRQRPLRYNINRQFAGRPQSLQHATALTNERARRNQPGDLAGLSQSGNAIRPIPGAEVADAGQIPGPVGNQAGQQLGWLAISRRAADQNGRAIFEIGDGDSGIFVDFGDRHFLTLQTLAFYPNAVSQ